MNSIVKTLIATTAAAFGIAVQAATAFNAERGPEQTGGSIQVDRAEIVKQLHAARANGEIVRGEIYPEAKVNASPRQDFGAVQRELSETAVQRAEAFRTGANGYTPG